MDNLYTDEQWYAMVDNRMSRPVPLVGADRDYEAAADRSYEQSVSRGLDDRDAMALAVGDGDLTFTGPNAESHFYSHWHLVEDVLVEVAGLDIIRLTINGRYRDERRYSWGSPSIWEVTITHSGGCYVKNFYT